MTPSPLRPAHRGSSLAALLAFAAAVILLAIFPSFVKKPYVLHMGVMLFLAVIQGQAWNVIGGYTGQYSVGHSAFFGIGAYATMMLLEVNKIPPWWGIWAAMASAMILSLIIGSICFRLRGPYFVLASIAVAEIVRLTVLNTPGITNGAEGILLSELPPFKIAGRVITDFVSKVPFYYIGLTLAILTILVTWGIQNSKLGYYFQAIREDQDEIGRAHV